MNSSGIMNGSNEFTENAESDEYTFSLFSYTPLFIIGFGLFGNTCSFIIFRFSRKLRKRSSIVILSYIVIMDTLSLFVWNLDHYIHSVFGFYWENVTLFTCKVATFNQYWSLQSSAFLLSFLSFDRYITVISEPGSFASRLPFTTARSANFWCIVILVTLAIVNSHILIFIGYYDDPVYRNRTVLNDVNKTEMYLYQNPDVHCGTYSFQPHSSLYPMWDQVENVLYSFVPFIIMAIFNSLLIHKIIEKSNDSTKIAAEKRKFTISLMFITFAFIIMTMPSTIAFGYFADDLRKLSYGVQILYFLDFVAFLNHTSVFVSCLLTNGKFRFIVFKAIKKIL